ncbi:hypothetical protein Bealeia1_00549 [Candidatus Bealeia paramacronuclearis]|uniref:Uncharacterized protein n=2 Tax=Candidatus Bealeia paramacronuclearis TaxID=1921001 RepID=A0ABZ2C3W6_9PROT|nr:hypothetical protein [Candidatus Bealeia paramacronuclearis]
MKKFSAFLLCASCLSAESFAMMEPLEEKQIVSSRQSSEKEEASEKETPSPQTLVSQFAQRAQLSVRLFKENGIPINFESFIKACPKIDENMPDEDVFQILGNIIHVSGTISQSFKVKPVVREYDLLKANFITWKNTLSFLKNKNSQFSKKGVKDLAQDVFQFETKFFDFYQKYGDIKFVTPEEYVIKMQLLADQMNEIGSQAFSSFKKRELFSSSAPTSEQIKAIELLAGFYCIQGRYLRNVWSSVLSQSNPLLKPQQIVACLRKNIESLERSSELYEIVFGMNHDNETEEANADITVNILTVFGQLDVYCTTHNITHPFTPQNKKIKKQSLKNKIKLFKQKKDRIRFLNEQFEKMKMMTSNHTSEKNKLEAKKDVLQHLQNTNDNTSSLEAPASLKLAYHYVPKIDDTAKSIEDVLNSTTMILFYAGEYDKALVRFKLYEEEMKEQLEPDALIFRAFLKSFTGDSSEIIALHNDLKQKRKAANARQRQKMISTIKDRIESSKDDVNPDTEIKVPRRILPAKTTSVISNNNNLLLEDSAPSYKESKDKKKKRHEEKLKEKEENSSSDDETSLQVDTAQKFLKKEESFPKIQPQFYLTSTAWRVHLSIESSEWKFTKDELKTYFEALGCRVKESRGKGGHQGAELPTRLVIKDATDTVLFIIPIGGFFTLPAWDQAFVPFYLRKEISNVRAKFGAFGGNVHEGQRPIEDKQKIFAEHE